MTENSNSTKQWEEFEKLPDEWQELWCNAIDRASGLYVEVSFAIKFFVSTYNMTPKREIPKALRIAWEAAGEKKTDGVVQYATDDDLGLFRAKYAFIKDMDNFLCDVKIMDGKTLAHFYEKNIKHKGIDLKQFVADVMSITKDREGQKGWNYQAIKKHPF